MDGTIYAGIQQRAASIALVLQLYLRLSLLMMIVTCMTILALVAFAKQSTVFVDWLADYIEVIPRQNKSALTTQGFACKSIDFHGAFCTYSPATGAFAGVDVTVYEDRVNSVSLTVRENALRVGDVPLSWGKPQIHTEGVWLYVHWSRSNINGLSRSLNGRFSYFLPLLRLSFTKEDLTTLPAQFLKQFVNHRL